MSADHILCHEDCAVWWNAELGFVNVCEFGASRPDDGGETFAEIHTGDLAEADIALDDPASRWYLGGLDITEIPPSSIDRYRGLVAAYLAEHAALTLLDSLAEYCAMSDSDERAYDALDALVAQVESHALSALDTLRDYATASVR